MKLQRLSTLVFLMSLTSCLATHQLIGKTISSEKEISVGVSIISLKKKNLVYAEGEQRLFTPASTAKLFTAAAALRYLGPQHRFRTEVFGERKGAALHHLYVKASGDPSLSSTDLFKLVGELHQLGVRKISGNIIIDSSIFDDVPYGKGWMLSDMNEGYSAPISGISVDHNRVAFGFFAGSKEGEKVGITAFPETRYFQIENKALTRPRGAIKFSLGSEQGIVRGEKIVVSGQIAPRAPTKYETLAVHDPEDFAGFLIAEELKRKNISFHGKVVRGRVPESATRLTLHVSPPLSEMIIDFVKMSNNHAAEMLVKTIGAVTKGAPGTSENGLAAMRTFLENEVGMKLGDAVLADGSGLSRYNQVSAKHYTDLLSYMYNDFRVGPEFIAALALFGEDGTLKDGKGDKLVGNVKAKTGSMTSLRSLAGYMRLDDGDVLAFAVLTSGSNQAKLKEVIENILTSLKKS